MLLGVCQAVLPGRCIHDAALRRDRQHFEKNFPNCLGALPFAHVALRTKIETMADVPAATGGPGRFVDGAALGFSGFSGFRMSLDRPEDGVELPHTQVTLVFQFGDPVVVGQADHACGARSVIVGLAEMPTPTRSSGTVDCIEVRLSPASAFGILGGMTMTELADGPRDLSAVFGRATDRAVDRASGAVEWAVRFRIVDSLLRSRQTGRQVAPEVLEAWSMLRASGGQASVRELCVATGWSANRLRSRFESQIGLTPKRAGRLIRFERASSMLRNGTSPVETAIGCGFADQSHLHREVRAFADLTPSELAIHQ